MTGKLLNKIESSLTEETSVNDLEILLSQLNGPSLHNITMLF